MTITRKHEDLHKISSFATLNSSMLFMPKPTINSSYINQETVVKVMQQQLLKKENLSDTTSMSSSTTSSPVIHVRHRTAQIIQQAEDASSSGDSSASSQRDSGLSSDGSPRDSLNEIEQTVIDGLIKQTERLMSTYITNLKVERGKRSVRVDFRIYLGDDHLEMSYSSIEHYFEQSLKFESMDNYSSALECCQQALSLLERILHLSHDHTDGISIYARTKKNSLLLRIRSLQKRQNDEQENLRRGNSSTTSLTSTFKPVDKIPKKNENIYDNNLSRTTSILSSTSRLSRPKKNVKFSDHVALIVPTSDDTDDPPSEHLIHSFLRKIHQQPTAATTGSDSDSDTPSTTNDMPIGLSECTLCHKRCSKTNQVGAYCSNCHFYMQRFQPTTS